ncbi:AAA family ATPase [Hyphococcus aureus]|uniref:AAA family ATPase n=2 Tax=Hyphococcus aureus TaxID=2666033 RepID=A0ABW1KUG0_9PROT
MRPVRLTLQAFGPYANREVIDFRSAVDAGLFGIYGQTGSGKSTIFSGMTFALFGEASKSEQDRTSLRSDHAAAELATEVEFVFDVGDRRFVVVRQPDQMRPKQRGEGETKSSHEAHLFEATGLSLDEITGEKRGKIIAEKKVRDVDAAVSELLGYGAEQFRQIVLLPQGRFEKFLSAKTNERVTILRDLFDVSLYQALMADLKEKAAEAEREVREERAVCAGRLKAEGFESTDALFEGIKDAEATVLERSVVEAEAKKQVQVAEVEFRSAEAIEVKFVASEQAQAKLTTLTSRKAEIAAMATQMKQAEHARLIVDVEAQLTAARKDVQEADRKLADATEAESQARQKVKDATEALTKEQERAPEVEAARKHKDDLERYAAVLQAASASAEAVEAALQAQRTSYVAFEKSKEQLQNLRKSRDDQATALKTARNTEGKRGDLTRIHTDLLAQKKAAEDYGKAESAVASAKAALEKESEASAEALQHEAKARAAYVTAEQALAAAQALHLATKLEDDQPCPVCGSIDHPSPATGDIENAGRDQAFREAREWLEKAERAARQVREKLAGQKATLEAREESLSPLEQPTDTPVAILEKVRQTEADINALGPSVNLEEAEAAIEALDKQITDLESETERLRTKAEKCRNAATEAKAIRDGKLEAVPESLRTQNALASALEETSRTLNALVEAKDKTDTLVREAREAALSAVATFKGAEESTAACKARFDKAESAFRTRLSEQGLTEELYQTLKPAIATIDSDRELVRTFETQLNEAQGAAKAAASAIGDLTRPNLPVLQEAQAAAAAALNKVTEARVTASNRVEQLEKLSKSLEETMHKLNEAEAESGPLRKIAALANGDNPLNLKLETYAIGAMFDRVLEAANLRLGPMTSSRYQLERDIEGGRGSRGLGIQVSDAHTGKSRGTDTLSGGETFIAALALALGLADVVESASGKVRLDTIFIDEGFGSLDTENGSGTLDQVLHVLNSLVKQSRAVGLISHVPLVQEAIPNGFYVRKGLAGSSVEERGLI